MTLDPRYLPRSYAEMLQDLIDLRDKLRLCDSTQARVMVELLDLPALVAEAQLSHIEHAAVRRMLTPA
jgi:hypothetical protein